MKETDYFNNTILQLYRGMELSCKRVIHSTIVLNYQIQSEFENLLTEILTLSTVIRLLWNKPGIHTVTQQSKLQRFSSM